DRLATQVAVIDGGRVIENDTPAALKARLGSTVIELGLPEAPVAQRAQALLAGSGIGNAELAEQTTVRLTTHDGTGLVVEALRALDADGIVPTSLAVHEPSLDDVFLALTGHRAAEPTNGDAGTH